MGATSWTGQVFVQALFVGLLAVGIFYAPWPALQLLCLAALLWFLFMIGRNPIFFFRRIFRLIVLASLPFIVAGVSFRVAGSTKLPHGGGDLVFEIEQGSNASLWAILALAGACLIADALLSILEARRAFKLIRNVVDRPTLFLKDDGEVTMVLRLLIAGPEGGVTVSGATLRVGGLWPRTLDCTVHVPADNPQDAERPIKPTKPLNIPEGQSRNVRVSVAVPAGRYRNWLRFRAGAPLLRLAPVRGELTLTATHQLASSTISVAFSRSPV